MEMELTEDDIDIILIMFGIAYNEFGITTKQQKVYDKIYALKMD